MNDISNAAAVLGKVGGVSGTGKSKTRSREHYCRIAKLFWDKARRPMADRFWEKVKRGSTNECWIWTGCRDAFGYGRFSINNKSIPSGRVAYQLTFGKIPNDLCVLHKCDNPACCNPSHLFLGTRTDNSNDKCAKGRCEALSQWDHPKARFTKEQILAIRREYETFKTPHRILAKKYGCVKSTIQYIITRKRWDHVTV